MTSRIMPHFQLYRCLEDSCIDYLALTPLGGPHATIQFVGKFEGESVLWTATIFALKSPQTGPDVNVRVKNKDKQYIDIALKNGSGVERDVEIGLPISSVDESTILKTMTMLRQYKNLHRGRHEYRGLHKDSY